MAPPRNSDRVQRYVTEFKRGVRWRENAGYDDLWDRMKDLYRGHHNQTASATDRLIVNMCFATKNVIAPSVAINNPKFTVTARRAKDAPMAIISEDVLNYQWRTGGYQEEFRRAVDDWLDFGVGFMKCGYKWVAEPKVKDGTGEGEANNDSDAMDAEGVDDREPKEGNVESEMNVLDDRPYAERVSPYDIYVDPDARTMGDMRWIAQRVRRPVVDARVDSRYKNTSVRNKLQPSSRSRWDEDSTLPDPPDQGGVDPGDRGFVDIIEYYDMRRQEMAVFASDATEGFLNNPTKWPYAFGQPFLMLRNYDIPDEFYPMGELESIETLQLELNETRSQMLNHRKRYSRKYLYLEDAFDATGVSALTTDEDNTMVPVNGGQDIDKVIIPMPSVGTPPDFYNQSQMIEDDIDKVSGVSDYMRGQMPDTRRTATEAAMLQDAQQSRAADKLAKVETFLALLGKRIIQLMQQYMTGEQVVRVVGQDGQPAWLTYDRDWIKGDFDFEVEAGSTQPQNETFRRQAAMQMVDAMAPFAQAGVVDPQAVARHVLQFGFGVKDPSGFLAAQQAAAPPGADGGQPPPGAPAPEGAPPGLSPGGPPMPGGGDPMAGGAPMPPPQGMPQQAPTQPPQPGGPSPEQLLQALPPQTAQAFVGLLQQLPPDRAQMLVSKLSELPPPAQIEMVNRIVMESGGGAPA